MSGKERGRGTGPNPSGKGKEEKHTFFFDGIVDSRGSRLDPECGSGNGKKECFRVAKTNDLVRSQRHKEIMLLCLFMNVYLRCLD